MGCGGIADRKDTVSWRDEAVCAGMDVNIFYPEKGGKDTKAKAICTKCPVRIECLNDALARNERFGVWGGMSERERRRLLRTAAR